jgi:SpoVK/Ycf46/Vps4 family AAA+-type ATPase
MAKIQAKLDASAVVGLAQVQAAYHTLNRQQLDSLATYLPVSGSWDEVVVGDFTMMKLGELAQRCQQRERLLAHLGSAFANLNNRGVRALFTGSSGTGKTLAARVLAAELGMDLYRVDLAAVVNKYIGETEKNLHRVLSKAEALDVILLLDEGDALLGSRTEVRSANDRYANLETDYLLQRLEHYQGIVIITTNAGENIDRAFQRRMDIVVTFVPPEAEERWQIWKLHLPPNHLVPEDDLQEVAIQCQLNGGQIRNAALLAALLALDEGQQQPVTAWHLEQALQSEYRKAGATFPLQVNGTPVELDGMTTFLDAFMRS